MYVQKYMRNIPFKLFVCFPNEINTQHSFQFIRRHYICVLFVEKEI